MALKVQKVDVWAGELQDQPGGLARALSAVANAGGSVECVIARRDPSRPGMGELFITPVRGAKVQSAARDAGMSPAANIATLRIEGSDMPGLGARMTEALAAAGVNLRGVTTAVIGRNFVTYIGLDNAADADRATSALRGVKTGGGGGGGAKKRSTAKRAGSTKKSMGKKRR